MNPKLHKSKELDEIIEKQQSEYINITNNLQNEGQVYCWASLLHKWNF